ncbi:MAG: alanine--tRNA ligase [Candidatus Marinimicrobia bacterium]|nr:alanine--tRNA ligase [Candidatus Neomarinimicrobiota bacterium]MCF7828080.1 alanine--tRNA ligase [Candidatus Neomarinimicrobiota bacterium]MCF7879745.1 alanine--tRNA ligase [Candidatus Neomarinimicrobiota bacterium]
MMTSSEIRQSFIDYFKDHGHKFVRSSPVVPIDDPTLLFTNAGMNQFKGIFLGVEDIPDPPRAVNSQKCIRVSGKHNDLEEVGKDTYHHTFFEMLGNWSFGDYYKEGAIEFAWELLTKVWGLPKEQLYATVHYSDDEGRDLWPKVTDIPEERVLDFGDKDNFWEMGDTGPCGPCSEIHIDRGEGYCDKQDVEDHECWVNNDCARFIEVWNLVFIQFNRDEEGDLHDLPNKHVDTGAGFERIVALLQEKTSNYDTDLFMPLIEHIEDLSGVKYGDGQQGTPHRVISDHVRTLGFAIADGALPSNEGRGYVLRRILRRAARFGRELGLKDPFIYKLVDTLVGKMEDAFPELREKQTHVEKVVRAEEDSFNETLDRGLEIFESMVEDMEERGETVLPGKDAFQLYDTYGFPVDLTRLMLEERNYDIDMDGFQDHMEAQRERARQAGKFKGGTEEDVGDWISVSEGPHSKFVGYSEYEVDTVVRKYRHTDEGAEVVMETTPFYAEAGGQVGDTGEITGEGFTFRVQDTQKHPDGETSLHQGEFTEGDEITVPEVHVKIDVEKRLRTMRNHTATHLLHKALKKHVGEHVNQAGSLVHPDYLRFDFTHYEKLTPKQIEKIEREVNSNILKNIALDDHVTEFDKAKEEGATALFGEKYGDEVRVVQIGDYSKELCGGTHTHRTGDIGLFKITQETSISAGMRRIFAITGDAVEEELRKKDSVLEEARQLLSSRVEEIPERIASLQEQTKQMERELEQLRQKQRAENLDDLMAEAEEVNGYRVIAKRIPDTDRDGLENYGDLLRNQLQNSDGGGIGILGTVYEEKPFVVCVVSDNLVEKGVKAGDIVGKIGKALGGGGGGRPHQATAGGRDTDKLNGVLGNIEDYLPEIEK